MGAETGTCGVAVSTPGDRSRGSSVRLGDFGGVGSSATVERTGGLGAAVGAGRSAKTAILAGRVSAQPMQAAPPRRAAARIAQLRAATAFQGEFEQGDESQPRVPLQGQFQVAPTPNGEAVSYRVECVNERWAARRRYHRRISAREGTTGRCADQEVLWCARYGHRDDHLDVPIELAGVAIDTIPGQSAIDSDCDRVAVVGRYRVTDRGYRCRARSWRQSLTLAY